MLELVIFASFNAAALNAHDNAIGGEA